MLLPWPAKTTPPNNPLAPSIHPVHLYLNFASRDGLRFHSCRFLLGVDFEKVVEYYEQHSGAAEEDGELVELVVGNHVDRAFVELELGRVGRISKLFGGQLARQLMVLDIGVSVQLEAGSKLKVGRR